MTPADIQRCEDLVRKNDPALFSVEQLMDYQRSIGIGYGVLLNEVRRLRQGLWDCAGISGADLDGDASPDALTYPDIVDYAKQEVQQLRDDYDESLRECTC